MHSATYVAINEGQRPFFIEPEVLRDITTDLAMQSLREFGEGREGPVALVTTYCAGDADLQVRFYAGAEAEHYVYGPTTVRTLAEEVSPL